MLQNEQDQKVGKPPTSVASVPCLPLLGLCGGEAARRQTGGLPTS